WTELNKERCRRLIRLGKMTKWGKKKLPKLTANSFAPDPEVVNAIKKARLWTKFRAFPKLYQRIRLYNVAFYKNLDKDLYDRALNSLLTHTKKGEMYGEWNDYGRLLEEQCDDSPDPH
ncbi:MAG: thymidylate synthase, partial [Bacilli bacterium]|nr:thymidylate synthase [Bacilli bacterium]